MGYLFLALFCGAVKGYCGKRISGAVKETRDAALANFLRMLLCVVIGFFIAVIPSGISALRIDGIGFLISSLSGIANAVFVVSWLFAVKAGAYMLVDVFLALGNILPIALSAVFFDERIEWNHILGFSVLIVAVLIMCSYNNTSAKKKLNVGALITLAVCGIGQGLCLFTQKWFVKHTGGASVPTFNLYAYTLSALVLGAFLFIKLLNKNEPADTEKSFRLRSVFPVIAIMAVMLFFNSYFMTLAALKLPTVVLYPMSTGLSLTLSTCMSGILFKEKVTARCIFGILLAFLALLIINLL